MVALGIFCTLFILIQNPAAAAETGQQEEKEKLSLNARAAVLMDADSGRILYGKNETMVFPMASTTKIMTLIVALEHNEPDQIVMASAGGICYGRKFVWVFMRGNATVWKICIMP